MSSSASTLARTLLILGYGPRVAPGIKDRFLAEGYNVAVVSRTARPELTGDDRVTHIPADLADPASVDNAFKTATEKYGPVSTVVFNGQ